MEKTINERYQEWYDEVHQLRYRYFEELILSGTAQQIITFIKEFNCRIDYLLDDLVNRNDVELLKAIEKEITIPTRDKTNQYRELKSKIYENANYTAMLNHLRPNSSSSSSS